MTIGGRTFLQVTGLDDVVQDNVEHLLPPGFSASPAPGSDILLMQVLGSADHVVALGGDFLGNAIADLQPGEFGLTNGTQMVIVRSDHIELVSPTYVLVNTPTLKCTGDILDNCNTQDRTMAGMRAVYNPHTHTVPDGTSNVPNETM